MDAKEFDKLAKIGAIERLNTGDNAVRVSLQYEPRLRNPSRSDRRETLKSEFEQIAQSIDARGAEVNLESLSVSGQTVEALIPVDSFDAIAEELSSKNVRVDLLIGRRAV